MIEYSAKIRGTGISKRSPEYIRCKIREGKAIIALYGREVSGFCYIETWTDSRYVVNSGLIVRGKFRQQGLATLIKEAVFQLSRSRYPQAKVVGITTSAAVMKINTSLGYHPVTFSELPTDVSFWDDCQSCPNHCILVARQYTNCLCTAMLHDPINNIEGEKNEG